MKHQLVKLVCEQSGITAAQADLAVDAVVDYFKTRLPVETNQEIQAVVNGHNGDALQ